MREIDFEAITACGEFLCQWLIEKVVWRANIVEEMTQLANLYREKIVPT